MDREKVIAALITNEETRWQDTDRTFLEGLTDEQLTAAGDIKANKKPEPKVEPKEEPKAEPEPKVEPKVNTPQTAEEYIAGAPKEIQDVLTSSLKTHNDHKDQLVAGLVANSRCDYTEDQLKAKSVDELQTLAKLAGVETSFEGRSTGTLEVLESDEEPLEAPRMSFDKSKEAKTAG